MILTDWKFLVILPRNLKGLVKKSDDKAFYIYEHPKHINYSSLTFTKPVQLCQSDDIHEDTHILGSCLEKTCHASYFPYFYGNDQCASMLDNLVTQGLFTTAQCVSLLDELATKHESVIRHLYCTSTSGEMFAGCYDWDNWTERLHICLLFNEIASECTARLRGDDVKNSGLKRLPQGVSSDSLLF